MYSDHKFEKIKHYKNFVICKEETKIHIILSRPQKVLRSGELIDQGRAILFPMQT